jgi:U3 small nucleolar RNA-associated protein 12
MDTARPALQEGSLEVFDLGASERLSCEAAHEAAVWCLAPLPDDSGFVSGSADKTVKFWQWGVVAGQVRGGRALGSRCQCHHIAPT